MVSQGHMEARTTLHCLKLSLYHREFVMNNRSSKMDKHICFRSLFASPWIFWYLSIKLEDYRWFCFTRFLPRQSRSLHCKSCALSISQHSYNNSWCVQIDPAPLGVTTSLHPKHTTSRAAFLHSPLQTGWKKNYFSWPTRYLVLTSNCFTYQMWEPI